MLLENVMKICYPYC